MKSSGAFDDAVLSNAAAIRVGRQATEETQGRGQSPKASSS